MEKRFIDLLDNTVSRILAGIITALILGGGAFLVQRLFDPIWLRVVLTVAYAACALLVVLFAFSYRKVQPTWRLGSLAILCVLTACYFLWVGTWIPSPDEPCPETATPSVSDLYVPFDEFDGYGSLDASLWSSFPSGDEELCSAEQHQDHLWIRCEHTGTQQYFPRWSRDEAVLGVAMAGGVLCSDSEAWLELGVDFTTGDGSQQDEPTHVYFLSLQLETARVVECYPQQEWRCSILAEVRVEPLQQHVLQIEYEGEKLTFYLDGRLVKLQHEHGLPHGSNWKTWNIQGSMVYQEEGECTNLEGYVNWIRVRRGT